eukprot:UN25458
MILFLVTTPLGPSILRTFSLRTVLITCSLLASLFIAGFGLVAYLPDDQPKLFLAVCLAIRTIQGIRSAIFEVALGSFLINSVSGDQVGTVIGWFEAARGVGMMVGPVIGGILL